VNRENYVASTKIHRRFAARERKPISTRAGAEWSFIHELGERKGDVEERGWSIAYRSYRCSTLAASIIATTTMSAATSGCTTATTTSTTTTTTSTTTTTTCQLPPRTASHERHHHHHHYHSHHRRSTTTSTAALGAPTSVNAFYHKPGTGVGTAAAAACRASRSWRSYVRSNGYSRCDDRSFSRCTSTPERLDIESIPTRMSRRVSRPLRSVLSWDRVSRWCWTYSSNGCRTAESSVCNIRAAWRAFGDCPCHRLERLSRESEDSDMLLVHFLFNFFTACSYSLRSLLNVEILSRLVIMNDAGVCQLNMLRDKRIIREYILLYCVKYSFYLNAVGFH